MGYLDLNKETFIELKNEYRKAVDNNAESFIFQNKELVTNYAKYLIEHLENQKLFN
jgi:CO dehydrogenase/acetyl-CoA synthase alpha subunit